MVARRATQRNTASRMLKPPTRNIGKAFVRPGAIARYVDNQKVSSNTNNASVLQACNQANKRRGEGPSDAGRGAGAREPRWQASAPVVDIKRKVKGGKRVRSYLSDEQLKFQYATVPTPRGIAQPYGEAQRRSKKARGAGTAPAQAQAQNKSSRTKKSSRTPMSPKLLSLPSDILTRVFCSMKHQDMAPIMRVCTRLADAAKTAITTHFNFLTPDPKRARYYGQTEAVPNAQAAFGSASQPTPMAPKQKRRSRRLSQQRRRKGTSIKKRSLVFDQASEDNTTTTTTTTTTSSSASGSGSGSGSDMEKL